MHNLDGNVNVIPEEQWLGREKMYFIWENDIKAN